MSYKYAITIRDKNLVEHEIESESETKIEMGETLTGRYIFNRNPQRITGIVIKIEGIKS